MPGQHRHAPTSATAAIAALLCLLAPAGILHAASAAAPGVHLPAGTVTPLPQPLAPAQPKPGPYVLRHIESRPDEHFGLRIRTVNGQVLLSDAATAQPLRGCTYTLNGWTDPDDAGRLIDEPIQPYTLYHATKAQIAAPMREWWRAMPEIRRTNPIEVRRGELFFIVLPEGETSWNGAGEGVNPIGRPLAFSHLPAFKLADRVYGFDGDFADEAPARLDELDVTFNRRPGQAHRMLYSAALEGFLRARGYDKAPRKAIHDFSPQDCIDFADSLPRERILAFDIEPPSEWRWMIDYAHPNFAPNMSRVIARLAQRGIKAYDWMSGTRFALGLDALEGFKQWGRGNEKIETYLKAYANPGQIRPRPTPNQVVNVGFGYDAYDFTFLPSDTAGRNSGPQALYLKTLDACELTRRVFAGRELLAFTWGFVEFDIGEFPRNHVVDIPHLDATARRRDNKPLYAPSAWQDSLTLALVYCRYLYYWNPGAVTWDPAAAARYARPNLRPGEMEIWEFTKGVAPKVTGGAYPGKESLILGATVTAAYRYSQVQAVCDQGVRQSAATTYRRADRAGAAGAAQSYPAHADGSHFIRAARDRHPFTLIVRNPRTGARVVFFQDVWSRPGRWTQFEFTLDGKTYSTARTPDGRTTPLRTDGNRLFIGLLD